jgi:hypothetical protein
MIRRRWLWPIGLYFLINIGGAITAAIDGEEMHVMVHLVLIAFGAAIYAGWWLGKRGRPENAPVAELPAERLQYLQQSVDAIALEVERVGEAQRFADKLRAEGGQAAPPKKD